MENAYTLQRYRQNDVGKKKDENFAKLSNIIMDNKTKLDEGKKEKEKLDNLLEKFTEDLQRLEQNPLKEEKIIFTNKMELEKKKDQLDFLDKNLSQKLTLTKEIKNLLEEKSLAEESQIKNINQINELKGQIEQLKTEIKSIETKSLASQLAKSLHKGESCPVCGSTEHPKPAEGIETEEKLLAEKIRN